MACQKVVGIIGEKYIRKLGGVAGEITQSVKHLLCKHEDMSSNPEHHRAGHSGEICNPSTGG